MGVGDIKFYNEKKINELVHKTGFTVSQMRHIEDKYYSTKEGMHACRVVFGVRKIIL